VTVGGLGAWVAGQGWQQLATGGRVFVGEWSDSLVCVVLANGARVSLDTDPDDGEHWLRLHPPAAASESRGAFPYLDVALVVADGDLEIVDVPSTLLQRMTPDISMPPADEVSFTISVSPDRAEPLFEVLARLPARRSPGWQVPASGSTVWRGLMDGDRAVLEHLPADDSLWQHGPLPVVGSRGLDWGSGSSRDGGGPTLPSAN
jgi:hypothetical protein